MMPIDAKKSDNSTLPLPIGISDYRLAFSEYFYIDKTLMNKDFLDERLTISLFTRPRRFSKTLNMDMFRTFFEKTDVDTSISFKDVKFDSWEETFENLKNLFSLEASGIRNLSMMTNEIHMKKLIFPS